MLVLVFLLGGTMSFLAIHVEEVKDIFSIVKWLHLAVSSVEQFTIKNVVKHRYIGILGLFFLISSVPQLCCFLCLCSHFPLDNM